MKPFLIIHISLLMGITAFGQQPEYPDSGFTNKTEAKNLTINGLKEGKWVEYLENNGGLPDNTITITTDTNKATDYRLIVYRNGIIIGIQREYYKSGKLEEEDLYSDVKKTLFEKEYYESGKLKWVCSYKKGKLNGKTIEYYESGLVRSVTIYKNGKPCKTLNYSDTF